VCSASEAPPVEVIAHVPREDAGALLPTVRSFDRRLSVRRDPVRPIPAPAVA